MRFKKLSPEVLVTESDVTVISGKNIETIKHMALSSPLGRARICAHSSSDELLHEMLIVLAKDGYIAPHKHLEKSESFHMIEGAMDVIIFNENGKVERKIELSAQNTEGLPFYYRLAKPLFHTVIPKTKVVVFHETTNGPFRREDTIYAEWAPAEDDEYPVQEAFITQILQ